jgi:hypothetical protein
MYDRPFIPKGSGHERGNLVMMAVLYTLLGGVSLGLLIICAYFLLRKGREAA